VISFDLDDELKLVLDLVRGFAGREIRPHLRDVERAGEVPEALARAAHGLGLPLLGLPPACGGQGLGALAEVVVGEELAAADPGIAAALPGPGAAATAVLALGDAAQASRLLARFGDAGCATARGALAWTDGPVPARVEPAGGAWRLSGDKAFVRGMPGAALLVVAAQAPGGDVAFLAIEDPAAHAGVRAGARLETTGLLAAHFGPVSFDGVHVPGGALLGGAPVTAERATDVLARVALGGAAWALGGARAAYEHALRYAHEREAFGRPIGHFQAVAFNLTDLLMEIEGARALLWRAAVGCDAAGASDEARRHARTDVARATAQVHAAAQRVTCDAVQILGGAGFVQDHPVEKWMRDARVLSLIGLPVEAADLLVGSALTGDARAFAAVGPAASALQPAIT
jgi:alkylation response protein AidB-like acyl-CoA dehydrogenase